MIVWLASYPKSGNTWVRSFLNSLIFSTDGTANLKKINQIPQYPLREHFKKLTDDIDDIHKLKKNWINSQNLLNLDNRIKFFKTHHVLCNLNGYNFTNYDNTFGVIYIIRDPRNVITSVMKHFSKNNYNEAKNFLLDENSIIGRNLDDNDSKFLEGNEMLTIISSWKTHYNSWRKTKNFLLIKYENLISEPEKEFSKIRKYLYDKLKMKFDDKKFEIAIESNSFEKLKKYEEISGFKESVIDKKTRKPINFFNLGPDNKWEDLLDSEIRIEIERHFKKEMLELGYI
tara:strand:+ start:5400 stop:6257 length:858 start_codon:yes stop_codon:yes gene_type:complete